jgi:tetratricopeptide (TPR) repeat protein
LIDASAEPDSVEAFAGELMGKLADPPHLSPAGRARVRSRIAASEASGAEAAAPASFRRRIRWAVLAIALVATGAWAARGVEFRGLRFRRSLSSPGPSHGSAGSVSAETHPAPAADPPKSDLRAGDAEQVGSEERAEERASSEERVGPQNPTSRRVAGRPVPALSSEEAEKSELASESRLLASALAELRQRKDPAAALSLLDSYDARFPRGALSLEAKAARVDALLALGRVSAAHDTLERIPLEGLPRGNELRVLRGELRAKLNQTALAIGDFNAVIAAAPPTSSLSERALFGRATCRSQSGDREGARADLEQYLRLFPNGRFASKARQSLGR